MANKVWEKAKEALQSLIPRQLAKLKLNQTMTTFTYTLRQVLPTYSI